MLRCVQSGIGTGHESIPVRRLGPAKSGDSETGGRGKNAVPESKLRVLKVFAHPFDRSLRAFLVGMGHHYEKLFSSQASADVGLASVGLENIREGLKHIVTCIVPEGIVDLLEMIQVSHHDPKRKAMPSGSTQLA